MKRHEHFKIPFIKNRIFMKSDLLAKKDFRDLKILQATGFVEIKEGTEAKVVPQKIRGIDLV